MWKTSYEYGELNSNGTVDTNKNTGNIAKQTLSFNGLAHPLVQSYKYDALYSITEAMETSDSVANWFQVWGYDRYGNRISFSQNIGGNPASNNPSIDANTNRYSANQGFTFDKNGNIITDVSADNFTRTFVFNGDNKQTEVRKNGITVGRYFYDGEGKRVKKVSDLETTIFVYSSGKLVAEYSTATPPATPTVNYTTTDHLGSPRVITDAIGQVTSRRDFLPFGEEVTINVGARSTALKYGSSDDKVRQKFTGYQKDTETSLDFAEARMYDNRLGRFTAVDPLLASGKSANPQTFNRYAYTSNNPIVRIDVNGKDWYYYDDVKVSRNGSSRLVRTLYWRNDDPMNLSGRNIYSGPGVIRESYGRNSGLYTAIDPYEGRAASFKSRAAAVAQYQIYLQERNINASRGFVDAFAHLGTANPLVKLIYEWGADAIIGRPDPNSNIYTVTNRSTNAMIIVGSTVAGPYIEGVMATRGSGQATGTVWDSIVATQPVHKGSQLPQSFTVATKNGSVWVHPNATKHMAEFLQMKAVNGTPEAVRLATQVQLESLQSAVSAATQQGIQYGRMMNVGGWQLKFAAPGQTGELPALIHALYKP